MAAYKVEEVPSPLSELGEGPHWDIETQNLYYIDIYGGFLHRYSFKENKTYSATVDGEPLISFIMPVKNKPNEFAIGIGRRIGIVSWDGVSETAELLRLIGAVESEEKYSTNRFNDGKCDSKGRIYAGTMRLEEMGDIFEVQLGSFYKYTKEKGFEKIFDNIGVSNGLAWNEITNKFYYIDSVQLDLKEFDYDPETGNISNERVVIDFKENGERPKFVADGMTIDADGSLYVATWGGSKILKINPLSGEIDLEIKMPCEQVTSAAFGGPNLDILYVTTANQARDREQPPPAGSLFKITGLGVKGTKMYRANV